MSHSGLWGYTQLWKTGRIMQNVKEENTGMSAQLFFLQCFFIMLVQTAWRLHGLFIGGEKSSGLTIVYQTTSANISKQKCCFKSKSIALIYFFWHFDFRIWQCSRSKMKNFCITPCRAHFWDAGWHFKNLSKFRRWEAFTWSALTIPPDVAAALAKATGSQHVW